MSVNKVLLMGNLTRDPELKALPSGSKVCNFSIATNFRTKDPSGNWKDVPEYHNIVVFGVQAENTAKYLKKGSSAFIEGRIQTRSWDGADGKKQYKTEINAEKVTFMSRGGSGSEGGSNNYQSATPASAAPSASPAPSSEEFDITDFGSEPNLEDIPF